MSNKLISKINPIDNIAISNISIMKGDIIPSEEHVITAKTEISPNCKLALVNIAQGETIFFCGYPIGSASKDIIRGEEVNLYNFTTSVKDLDNYGKEIIKRQQKEIKEDTEKWSVDAPFMSAYQNGNKIGFKKYIAIITSERKEKLVLPFENKNIKVIKASSLIVAKQIANHPNVAKSIIFDLALEQSEDIYPANSIEEIEKLLPELEKEISFKKKESLPISEFILCIYGKFDNPEHNYFIGKFVDKLAEIGASVLISLEDNMVESFPIVKYKVANKPIANRIQRYYSAYAKEPLDKRYLSQLEKETANLLLIGNSLISNIVNETKIIKKGINIIFKEDEKSKALLTKSHVILDLSGNLTNIKLSPIAHVDEQHFEENQLFESLLYYITNEALK